MKHKPISLFWIKNKKIDAEKILEKLIWNLLKISKQTDTSAEPDVKSLNYMKYNMKSFN